MGTHTHTAGSLARSPFEQAGWRTDRQKDAHLQTEGRRKGPTEPQASEQGKG